MVLGPAQGSQPLLQRRMVAFDAVVQMFEINMTDRAIRSDVYSIPDQQQRAAKLARKPVQGLGNCPRDQTGSTVFLASAEARSST